MKRRAVMVVGAAGSGKTSLLQALAGEKLHPRKTQALEYGSRAIDTPGEYSRHRRFIHALVSTAAEARAIWVLQDSTAGEASVWPEMLLLIGRHQLIRGIITKIDHPRAAPERAAALLAAAGVRGPYYQVSALTGAGIDALRDLPELAAEGGAKGQGNPPP